MAIREHFRENLAKSFLLSLLEILGVQMMSIFYVAGKLEKNGSKENMKFYDIQMQIKYHKNGI